MRIDHLGNRFLKVPLGKLNTERLVPIEDSTVSIIEKLRGDPEQAMTKTFLIETRTGKKTRYQNYIAALAKACQDLDTGGKMGSHRLRHTYATTLLNAGMSLVGIMKLLGHNDHRMTLRYTAITQETVGKEYFEALSRLEHRYVHLLDYQSLKHDNPPKLLADCIHLIQNFSADDQSIKTVSRTIIKRIQRIQADLEKLFPASHPSL